MNKIIFEKIRFINITLNDLPEILKKNGLFLFPSAPGLASIRKQINYYNSLKQADYVFFDSSFFVLLLRIFKNIKCHRFSGYTFFKFFLKYLSTKKNTSIFLIDPKIKFSNNNKKLIKNTGVKFKNINNYIAPIYNPNNLKDLKLLKLLKKNRPKIILINIGGGTQEVLGLYLKKNLKFRCKIICTGAAISFFTKDQAPINDFIDKNYIGWLVRFLRNPITFGSRLIYAFKLIKIVINGKVKNVSY